MLEVEVVELFDDCAQVKVTCTAERSDKEDFQVVQNVVVYLG